MFKWFMDRGLEKSYVYTLVTLVALAWLSLTGSMNLRASVESGADLRPPLFFFSFFATLSFGEYASKCAEAFGAYWRREHDGSGS